MRTAMYTSTTSRLVSQSSTTVKCIRSNLNH